MNEPEPRITNTQKEKDPKKVDAGKKLGALSKMAKNQKSLNNKKYETEEVAEVENTSSTSLYVGFAAVVVAGCLGALYFSKQQPNETHRRPPSPKLRRESPPPKLHQKSALISLDD